MRRAWGRMEGQLELGREGVEQGFCPSEHSY